MNSLNTLLYTDKQDQRITVASSGLPPEPAADMLSRAFVAGFCSQSSIFTCSPRAARPPRHSLSGCPRRSRHARCPVRTCESGGLRNVGIPWDWPVRYNDQGADEWSSSTSPPVHRAGRASMVDVIEDGGPLLHAPDRWRWDPVGGRHGRDAAGGADKISLNSRGVGATGVIREGPLKYGCWCTWFRSTPGGGPGTLGGVAKEGGVHRFGCSEWAVRSGWDLEAPAKWF